jgi:hypothetical protein
MADNLLSTRENAVVYLAAQGKNAVQIAEATGSSTRSITVMLQEERVQFEIRRLQHRLFGKDQKNVKRRFDDMVEAAQNTIEEIINDDNPNVTIKPQLRFAAAQEILDRSLGKPKQTVETHVSLIKDLFDRLDDPKTKEVIDINEVPDALGSGEEVSPMDEWAEKNL